MHSTNFYTVKTNGQEVIRDHKTLLQIKVYRLHTEPFVRKNNVIVLYGVDHGKLLAFEISNIKDNIQLIALALDWYVDYSGQPGMVITGEDPRQLRRLKRA
jgi:hypothetical protein